jgi:hypothetical protein
MRYTGPERDDDPPSLPRDTDISDLNPCMGFGEQSEPWNAHDTIPCPPPPMVGDTTTYPTLPEIPRLRVPRP